MSLPLTAREDLGWLHHDRKLFTSRPECTGDRRRTNRIPGSLWSHIPSETSTGPYYGDNLVIPRLPWRKSWRPGLSRIGLRSWCRTTQQLQLLLPNMVLPHCLCVSAPFLQMAILFSFLYPPILSESPFPFFLLTVINLFSS